MNAALEQLLSVWDSKDLFCKELDLNMELAVHLNKAQTTEAIRQTRLHSATMAYTVQKVHQKSVLALEHQAMEEERWACQIFVEAFRAVMGSCSPESWETLLYPLQVLTGNALLAALLGMLATVQLWVMADEKPALTAPTPRVPETSGPPTGTKCKCCSSNQDVQALRQDEEETLEPNYPPKEYLHWKRKEGRPVGKALKEPHHEPFSNCAGGLISRPMAQLQAGGVGWPPTHFDKCLPLLTSWAMRSMRCRRTGIVGGISGLPNGLPGPPARTFTSLRSWCPMSHQR